jgi:LPXTG-site transpeptidase (sortase) family protein
MSSRSLRKAFVVLMMAGVLVFPASSSSLNNDFRIVIPRIHLNAPLSYTSRNLGPQVYYQDFNTLMIAGHRVTHTHPFYYINEVRKGDSIYIDYNSHTNKYVVTRTAIYTPNQAGRLSWYPGLVLSGCHPRHSATYRFVVFARPV